MHKVKKIPKIFNVLAWIKCKLGFWRAPNHKRTLNGFVLGMCYTVDLLLGQDGYEYENWFRSKLELNLISVFNSWWICKPELGGDNDFDATTIIGGWQACGEWLKTWSRTNRGITEVAGKRVELRLIEEGLVIAMASRSWELILARLGRCSSELDEVLLIVSDELELWWCSYL